MSLNDIQMPPSLITELYKSSLIETNKAVTDFKTKETLTPKKPDAASDAIVALGNNGRNILIVVDYSDAIHLPDIDFNFLVGILGACKLSMSDVAIININKHSSLTYKEITEQFDSKNIFLFGVEPSTFGLPMSFPHFQSQNFSSRSFLFSPSLTALQNDKVSKSKLWVCLRRIFNV